jgi:Uma2 family endonuclease
MVATIILDEGVEIPDGICTLADFRRWTYADDFPERGRIDYINGRIEVDMSPEDLFCHGTVKMEIGSVLHQLVKQKNAANAFSDRTRIASLPGKFSAEPDLVFISHRSIDSGRVKLVPKRSRKKGRYIEVLGPPEQIVEIVSDSSVAKDTRRLPSAYFAAGVPEFWLVDAREDELVFRIHRRGETAFVPRRPDREGYQRSSVLGQRFRLERHRDTRGNWQYDLLHAE